MKWSAIILFSVVIFAGIMIFLLAQPIDENQMIEDAIKAYYKAQPYEEGKANKSDAEVIIMEQTVLGDRADVSVTLKWEELGTSAVFDLVLEKKEGKWVVVSEEQSFPAPYEY